MLKANSPFALAVVWGVIRSYSGSWCGLPDDHPCFPGVPGDRCEQQQALTVGIRVLGTACHRHRGLALAGVKGTSPHVMGGRMHQWFVVTDRILGRSGDTVK
jgi:hypothetical protein